MFFSFILVRKAIQTADTVSSSQLLGANDPDVTVRSISCRKYSFQKLLELKTSFASNSFSQWIVKSFLCHWIFHSAAYFM